jgi:hypothetical protein
MSEWIAGILLIGYRFGPAVPKRQWIHKSDHEYLSRALADGFPSQLLKINRETY